jgi:hypothetical protein
MGIPSSLYQHWTGQARGIWHRRLVVANQTLKGIWSNKWIRHLCLGAWVLCLAQSALLFGVGQLLVKESAIYSLVNQLDNQPRAIVSGLVSWILERPDLSVSSTYGLSFYYFTRWFQPLALVIVTLTIPTLISQDLSSRAIIIYRSKALDPADYLIGKFMAIFGLLSFVWLLPAIHAWLLGCLLSPSWSFLWHARQALMQSVGFVVASMAFLSLLALGVSALSKREKATTIIWLVLWLVGHFLAKSQGEQYPWMAYLSLTHILDQWAICLFNPATHVSQLMENLPLLESFSSLTERWLRLPSANGMASLIAAGFMAGLSLITLKGKVKPE